MFGALVFGKLRVGLLLGALEVTMGTSMAGELVIVFVLVGLT